MRLEKNAMSSTYRKKLFGEMRDAFCSSPGQENKSALAGLP